MTTNYKLACAISAALTGYAGAGYAADTSAASTVSSESSGLAEIVVTAQRRSESIQDVPITIQALSGAQLKDLSVSTIEDVLKYLPNVTFGTNGPGSGNIFMRGLSAGFAGNQSSATIAPFPNVATYLDDQSVTFPARNLDVYYADMERIEVLEGPQGTLFGGGAEAGVIRYITNKPKINVTEGNVQASYGITAAGGDPNSSGIAVLNVPLIADTLAVRGVIYVDHRGGYIDNVPSTFTRMNTDPGDHYFTNQAVGGVCPNGLPANPKNGGCVPANSQSANNYDLAGTATNPVDYTGIRVSALWRHQQRLERADPAELPEHGSGWRVHSVPDRFGGPGARSLAGHLLQPRGGQGQVREHRLDGQRQDRRPQSDLYRRVPGAQPLPDE